MKKIVYSESLKNRLTAAKENGSEIAAIILKELKKKPKDAIGDAVANYFDTLLVKCGGVPNQLYVTCCNRKDVDANPQHGNPQFPYLKENRTRLTLTNFATLFGEVNAATRSWGADEIDYQTKLFQECMLIGEKITFRVGTTLEDFKFAYLGNNYLPFGNENTLGNSCMRHESLQENVAGFYVLFAGAKILIGQTASGQVVSRAILWDGVTDGTAGEGDTPINKFIDRVYVTHSHLYKRMEIEALRFGYPWKKRHNDYSSQTQFLNMQTGEAEDRYVYKKVPASKWHKGGSPYMDTMCYIVYEKESEEVLLANCRRPVPNSVQLYNLQSTSGYGDRINKICPVCGAVHSNDVEMCGGCYDSVYAPGFNGSRQFKHPVTIKGVVYPREMTSHGRLTKLAQLSNNVFKIGIR